jgi:hypothetical protein
MNTADYTAAAAIFDQMGWDKVVDYGLGPTDNVQDAVEGLDTNFTIVDVDGGDLGAFIPTSFSLAREDGCLSVYERTITKRNPRRASEWQEVQSIYVARGESKIFIHSDL